MHTYTLLHRFTSSVVFLFHDTASTVLYTLSLHDALPISARAGWHLTQRRCGRLHLRRRSRVVHPTPWSRLRPPASCPIRRRRGPDPHPRRRRTRPSGPGGDLGEIGRAHV